MNTFARRMAITLSLSLLPITASAGHLHYVPITDTRFPPGSPQDPFVLADQFGDVPLEGWIIYSGDDRYSTIDEATNTYGASRGTGTAEAVFDYPMLADQNNSQTTAFFEFEIQVDDSGLQSIEIGFTDLINQIKWDESSRVVSGSRGGVAGDDVTGVPRLSDVGAQPLRVQLYFHFTTYVYTAVIYDDVQGTSASFSWQGSDNPFANFYGDDIPGTDPDNLIIYPFALCEAECSMTMLDWDRLNCDSVAGQPGEPDQVDVANCRPMEPSFLGVLEDGAEAFLIDEQSSGDLMDVDFDLGVGAGIDGDVSYALTAGNDDIDGDGELAFAIDSATGLISINDPDDLDVEAGVDHFILTVSATDLTEGSSYDAYVVVLLRDIDDSAPCSDGDDDGYGSPGSSQCSSGPETDCDDGDPAVNPGAVEIPGNGLDDDCNATTPDGPSCNGTVSGTGAVVPSTVPLVLMVPFALVALRAARRRGRR